MSQTVTISSDILKPEDGQKDDHLEFQIPDRSGSNHIRCTVDYDEGKKPDVIKMKLKDGNKIIVSIKDLNHILFTLSDHEDQMKLMPMKHETVHWRRTVLGIRATKPIAKGEMINFPIEISFPCTNIREIIGAKIWDKEVQREQKKDIWTPTGFRPTQNRT